MNLHNDTGETPVLPDVIWVFMGTNDFTHSQSTLGSFAAINYEALIIEGEDGTFTYATPATACEAYAIMLHKMQQAYPDAEIFCLNMLPRRVPMTKNDRGPVTEFNSNLGQVIAKAGVHLVDLENCGIPVEPVYYDTYMHDSYVHPNDAGMDLMTAALLGEMVGTHSVVFNGIGSSNSNTAYYVEDGSEYTTKVSLKSSYVDLEVKVTMGGEDITSSVYSSGTITIPAVTGDVVITATATLEYIGHLQALPEDVCKDVNIWTALKPEKYYFDGSAWSTKYYSVTFPISAGDQIWAFSFANKNSNGNSNTSGIRVTYFLENGTYKSVAPGTINTEFNNNGYITAPAGAVAVNVPMWDGSTSSRKVLLLNKEHNFEVISSSNGITFEECSACGLEQTNFDGAVAMEGFSIRLKNYNGLRGIFSFDHNKNAALKELGYELLEYGAVVVSKDKYTADGSVVTIDPETRKLTTSGVKQAVWADGEYVGKILGTKNGIEQFALSIVKYEANHASDVYYNAYSIYKAPSGETIVTLNEYPNEEYRFINLYQTALDMYVNGAINASNTDDEAVWNTLLTGVVTLTSGEYGTGATDMDGNAFGDSFTFKEISAMASGNVKNDKIKITLFNDYRNSEYVAIFRGEGNYGSGATGYSEFGTSSDRTMMTHPRLTSATNKKITTYIFDEGITGTTGNYTLRGAGAKTIVYSSTFQELSASTFHTINYLETMYMAKAEGVMQNNVEGLLDLSNIKSTSAHNFYYNMGSSAVTGKAIHLPATITKIGDAFVSQKAGTSVKYKVEKVWCGDTAEPEAGVIDLSGATSLKSITGSSFSSMSGTQSSYIMIIPDSLTSLSTNCFGNTPLTEIRQETYSDKIAASIAANTYIAGKVKYCDLEGNEWGEIPSEEELTRILFIGNSFTYYNDMPTAIFSKIAKTTDKYVSVTSITNGGHTLAQFADSTDSYGKQVVTAFSNYQYDYVILQEQSHRPISNPDSFFGAVRTLTEMATKNGAKTLLYATWGYDADHKSLSSYGTSTADMEMKLRAAYTYIGEQLGIPVCHVGAAMTYAFTNHPSVSLYQSDNYHPLTTASTLAALTIYSAIYDKDPASVEISIDGVTEAQMSAIKESASFAYSGDVSVPESYIDPTWQTEANTLRILAIGNSFSIDGMEYLWNIANDAKANGNFDYEYLSLGNLYIGSCSLDTHWSNIQNDSGSYTYYTNTNGTWSSTTKYKLSAALASQEWDIITIQQNSGNSGLADTYANLANIVDYVEANKTNENAEIYWHMTWAYQQNSSHSDFSNYGKDQTAMYNAITGAVQSSVLTNTGIAGVIPSGTAIQNARSSYVGDTLTRDGYHLSHGLGRYIAGMTWFAYLTGESIDNITWVPDEYKEVALYLDVVKESVKNALTAPYAVTASALTTEPEYSDEQLFLVNGLDFASYSALDLTDYTHFQKYYQSEKQLPSSMTSGSSLAKEYIGFGLFDKTILPVGTVIIVDSGYKYRPEGWVDAETKNASGARPAEVSKSFVLVDDAWWGDFTIRGFNLTDGTEITEAEAAHFRIYIPG